MKCKLSFNNYGRGKSTTEVVNQASDDPGGISSREMYSILGMAQNASLLQRDVLARLLNSDRNIDTECGYPMFIGPGDYHQIYEREGIASRVVDVWPEESWSSPPEVYENEDSNVETAFEKAWKELEETIHAFHYLFRADVLSGIGRFGLLLIGIDDGKQLMEPVDGIKEDGTGKTGREHQVLYLRPFEENDVTVSLYQKDERNRRFGHPVLYNITFQDESGGSFSKQVHWSRVIHLADNRQSSEVFGTPRLQRQFNRMLDIRKILGGSGEMFWKGGFPGLSLEVQPQTGQSIQLDTVSLKEQVRKYYSGLQRYLALQNVTAKSLQPQVADPSPHLQGQLDAVAFALGIPKRILFGSESAQLASTQDMRTWNRRVAKRQKEYLTPMMVRPFVDRLIQFGVLPEPADMKYIVMWGDLNALTDDERATTATKWADMLAKYVGGNASAVVPPDAFLSIFAKLDQKQINEIEDALKKFNEENAEMDESAMLGEDPTDVPAEGDQADEAQDAADDEDAEPVPPMPAGKKA